MTQTELQACLEAWQRRWRMQDWQLTVRLVDVFSEGETTQDSQARFTAFKYERRGVIEIISRAVPDQPYVFSLAHEFAHVLLFELYQCHQDVVTYSSSDTRTAAKDRWDLQEERFCNAFAAAIIKEETP